MNLKEFMEFSKILDEQCYEILGFANQEYAAEGNKFENFDMIAQFFNAFCPEFNGQFTPRHVAAVYFLKHFIACMKGVSIREDVMGRYSDALNYIRLMAGMTERDRRNITKLQDAEEKMKEFLRED